MVFNMTQVFSFIFIFFYYFDDINFNGWMVSLTVSITFIFIRGLSLRLTISRKRIIKLSFVPLLVFIIDFVLIFFG